jgi:dolichol-phosphate mannosyltransferase
MAVYADRASDPALVTLLDQDPGVAPAPGGTVRIEEYGLNRVRLASDTPGPSIVRLADLAFPGWRVTVDGKPARALTADGMLRAVAVPAGRHAIVWEYHDPAFDLGLRVSIGAFVLILALYLVPPLVRRRQAATGRAVGGDGGGGRAMDKLIIIRPTTSAEHRGRCSTGCSRPRSASKCSSWTTTRPMAGRPGGRPRGRDPDPRAAPGKMGLGSAYVAGFRYALAHGAQFVFEMDADFSHDPVAIGSFLEAAEQADVVLGSRYLHGVTVVHWPLRRLILSYSANVYTRLITGLPVRDATGGFKCFRRRALEAVNLDQVKSDGYAFQIEMSYKCWRKGFRIVEIPITFVDRRAGVSKMNRRIVWEAAWMVWRLRIMDLLGQTAWLIFTP